MAGSCEDDNEICAS